MQFYSTDTQFFPVVSGLRAFPKMCVGTREFCESRFRHPRSSGWAWELRGRMQVKGTELEPAGEPRYTSIFRSNLRLLIVFSLRNAHEFPLDGFARTGGAGRWGASTAPQFAFKMRGWGAMERGAVTVYRPIYTPTFAREWRPSLQVPRKIYTRIPIPITNTKQRQKQKRKYCKPPHAHKRTDRHATDCWHFRLVSLALTHSSAQAKYQQMFT